MFDRVIEHPVGRQGLIRLAEPKLIGPNVTLARP